MAAPVLPELELSQLNLSASTGSTSYDSDEHQTPVRVQHQAEVEAVADDAPEPDDDHVAEQQSLTSSTAMVAAPGRQHRRGLHRSLNDGWTLEIAAGLLSVICTIALVILLICFDGKPLADWHSQLQLNTIVSILATIAKSSFLLPVAECISQTKWIHFQGVHHLKTLQTIDDASRGPLGAVQILASTKVVVLWIGALVTLVALGMDPFIQQVISYPQLNVTLSTPTAYVPVSRVLDSGQRQTEDGPQVIYPNGLEHGYEAYAVKSAALQALYNGSIDPPFQCAAPVCHFDTFSSLSLCSSCNDVSKSTTTTDCGNGAFCTYVTPAGARIRTTNALEEDNSYLTLFNSTSTTNLSGSGFSDLTVSNFSLIKFNQSATSSTDQPVLSAAYDCSLRWCGKTWSSGSVSNGIFEYGSLTQWDFRNVTSYYPPYASETMYATITPDVQIANGSGEGNWSINSVDWGNLSGYLDGLFSWTVDGGDDEGIQQILYRSSNVPAVVQRVADTMTNAVRTSRNQTFVPGQSLRAETFIKISWPYMILPIIVVIAANVLLLVTVLLTRKRHAPVWKSSTLPLLFHASLSEKAPLPQTARLSEMEKVAEQQKVQLTGATKHDLQLVCHT